MLALFTNRSKSCSQSTIAKGNQFAWFLTWHSRWMDANEQDFLRKVYCHQHSITRDELPDW